MSLSPYALSIFFQIIYRKRKEQLYPKLVTVIGHLTFGGADVTELADKYGTPLYLLDENRIREKCRVYSAAMRESFGENSAALYACKALCFKGVYGIIHDEGLCADVVSGGEIYTALAGGFPAEKSIFTATSKPTRKLNMPLTAV